MLQREYTQEYQTDMGTAGTKTYDLDFSDPITEFVLTFRATNGASGNVDNPIESCISTIDLVDGGEILWSLPGDVALGYAAQLRGLLPLCYRSGAISDTPYVTIPLRFGRYPFDPVYAFNPIAHKNPQLRVTFDEATIRAAGATGYVSDSFTFTLMVRLMEQMATPPIGFLSARHVETYTSLASGEVLVNMPTDRVIRSILTRIYETGVYCATDVSKVKLSVDGGKRIPFELYTPYWLILMTEQFAPVTVPLYSVCDGDEAYDTWLATHLDVSVRGHNTGQIVTASSATGSQITVHSVLHDGTVWGVPIHMLSVGWGVHNTLIYPFGLLDNPSDWLDPRDFRKLDYIMTQGGAGGEVDVGVESVYSY